MGFPRPCKKCEEIFQPVPGRKSYCIDCFTDIKKSNHKKLIDFRKEHRRDIVIIIRK